MEEIKKLASDVLSLQSEAIAAKDAVLVQFSEIAKTVAPVIAINRNKAQFDVNGDELVIYENGDYDFKGLNNTKNLEALKKAVVKYMESVKENLNAYIVSHKSI